MNRVKFRLFSAGLVLALAFTFSCSLPDDEDGGGSSSSYGGGGLPDLPSSSSTGGGGNPSSSSGGSSNGSLQYFLGYGYDVVNSSYINRSDVKISYPVLDQKRMINDGVIASDPIAGEQDFQISVGLSISQFYSDRNAGLGINVSDATGALFSGKFSAEFSVRLDESRIDTNSYLRGRTYRYTQDDYIVGARAERLLEYLTDDFAADLQTKTASQLLDRYGTHILVRYYKGGALEFNYAYNGKSLTSAAQMRTALQGSFDGISGGVSGGANTGSSELELNSKFHYYTYGGTPIDAFSLEELRNNYSTWLNSISSNADICGIGNFDQSLVPLWELVEANGYSSKAKEMENEFIARAIKAGKALLVKKLRIGDKLYNQPGSYTFTFSDAGRDSPAEIEVYALGAGGGGQGGHKKSGILENFTGTGGAGGGGAAAYMKLAIEEPATFNISVGTGGTGGSSVSIGLAGNAQSGNPGNNGGATTVGWASQSITLSAAGGVGGGGAGTVITGGAGGTAAPARLPTSNRYYRDGETASGGNGTSGDQFSDITSEGGKAASINKGSDAPFAGGNGAKRLRGGNMNPEWAESGGGGFGGYDAQNGKVGGPGLVYIITKYYVDE